MILNQVKPGRHSTKIEFFHYGFLSKCDQIRWILQIWSYLLKKSLMEKFIFCVVRPVIFINYLTGVASLIFYQKR